ncbi:LysE family translocator [Halalkalibacterium ligniniphilum]|uniref:LysE family translocator n=1 Tax=Halalkalibacterium ligniniphilum TaxID=1134413 RepID=UPI000344AB0C|nr:LysE family transporter [Halalkalibacterium ligniniphilum]
MSVFLSYIVLGLSLAAPMGPVNAAQLDRGVKYGFLHAWLVGLGAILADVIYMVLVYFGLVHFLEIPFMQTFLWLFGFFVLVYTGVETLFGAKHIAYTSRRKDETYLKSFLTGFLISLLNPLTILFWLGIFGSVLAKTALTFGTNELFLYSSAIFIGLLSWDVMMAIVASSFRQFLMKGLLTFTSIISGLFLIGFGVYFGLQAFRALIS